MILTVNSNLQGVWGFISGGLTWFAIPFSLATTMGLAYLGLSSAQGAPLLSDEDVAKGKSKLDWGHSANSLFSFAILNRSCRTSGRPEAAGLHRRVRHAVPHPDGGDVDRVRRGHRRRLHHHL